MTAILLLTAVIACGSITPAWASELAAQTDRILPELLETYRKLHSSPELSYQEEQTAALLATRLRQLGYEVHTGVGRFSRPGIKSHGVVGVLRNGSGFQVLVRTEMDALPVTEQTGLPYTSTVRTRTATGDTVAVAHACGHDIHMATFLGVAELLATSKDRWRGTLLLIAQPAEEMGDGAEAMLADGLYERFGRPNFVLALHDDPQLAAGSVGYASGFAMSAMTSVDILVRGVGTHGSRPEAGKDPIVLAAQIINALQTIVSRQVSPLDAAVVTVGAIHGGTKRNIIPEEVVLSLTIRTYQEEVRRRILDSIEKIARFTALAASLPEDLLPQVVVKSDEELPSLYNDPELTSRIVKVLQTELGPHNVLQGLPLMASEDFSRFSLGGAIPSLLYRLGTTDSVKLSQSGDSVAALHSPEFYPAAEPTIRTGVRSMTSAVLDLFETSPSTHRTQ